MTSRADACVIACAEAWRGDGEVVASPFGWIPTLGARLAKATFEPDLVITDGEAMMLANVPPLGSQDKVVEGWIPFRSVFDVVAAGRRHVMMGASQIDRHGNQNISCVGDHAKPKVQLIGVRGGPGNTINHPTSYWVPNHSKRTFVERVDFVSGLGYDRTPGPAEIRYVISNLGVFDFPDGVMRCRTLHPGVTADEVRDNTGFDIEITGEITREPTDEEQSLIEKLDPDGHRHTELP